MLRCQGPHPQHDGCPAQAGEQAGGLLGEGSLRGEGHHHVQAAEAGGQGGGDQPGTGAVTPVTLSHLHTDLRDMVMLWKARSPAPAVPTTARLPRPQEGREWPGTVQRRRATSNPDTEAHTTSTALDTFSQHYLALHSSIISITSLHLATSTLLRPLDTQAAVASTTPTQYRELAYGQGSYYHNVG